MVSGNSGLDQRSLAIVHELWKWREAEAERRDQPGPIGPGEVSLAQHHGPRATRDRGLDDVHERTATGLGPVRQHEDPGQDHSAGRPSHGVDASA